MIRDRFGDVPKKSIESPPCRPFDMKSVPAASEEEVAAAAGRERKPSQPEGMYGEYGYI